MTEYKMTIIMSNYNQAQFISQAIESVLSQKTDFPFQIIITDDCSKKDNSIDIIKQYAQKYPDIIKPLFAKENGRYLKNILRAKAITKTPYFTLLDADDYWTDVNYLQDAVDFLDNHDDFVIYSRNVTCIDEDGNSYQFMKTKRTNLDYTLEDYFNQSIYISQTTGTVFRNVIFSKGIPKIMEKAIGTISEKSFEGDFDRYIMHLRYGKSHFVNKSSGVYRVLATGLWGCLSEFERHAAQIQGYIDYDEYFEYKYHKFFLNAIYGEIRTCCIYIDDIIDKKVGEQYITMFNNALILCKNNQDLITTCKPKPEKLKYRIFLSIYLHFKKILLKKGLL